MITVLLAILIIYSAWARGGTVVSLQGLLPVIAAAILITLAFKRDELKRMLRDPVSWIGALFLLLLLVQWWNAGRVHFFDPFSGEWSYTAPRIAWLPAAFSAAEAVEMLRWFFPAWALIVAIRAAAFGLCEARRLLAVVAVNGAVLALFGIVQQLSGTDSIFWIEHLDGTRFFASFGYENHAGSYFVLTAAISAGLLIEEFFGERERPRMRIAGVWTVVLFLNFAGANLSHSRAGIMLAWMLAAGALAATIYYMRKKLYFSRQVDAVLTVVAIAVVVGVVVIRIGGPSLMKEVSTISQLTGKVAENKSDTLAFDVRAELASAAFGIWQDYPAFGCGGWGYRYLLPYELPDDHWEWASGTKGRGKANVHNDALQFLAEFGLVGFGLMLLAVIILLIPLINSKELNPMLLISLLGTVLVLLHSFIDLPFRCPAILYTCLIVWACANAVAEKTHQWSKKKV